MATAQLAAVSYLARYAGRTHALYAYQLRQWFAWCPIIGVDPLAWKMVIHSTSRHKPAELDVTR